MTVRSRKLWSTGVPAGSTALTVYTVPANRVAIARAVKLSNLGAAAGNFDLRVNGGRQWVGVIQAGTTLELGYWVLEEGDTVSVTTPAASAGATYGAGSLLDGDPS